MADAPTPPAVADSHARAIRELIDTTGALDRELARVDLLVAQLKANSPDLPEAVWTDFAARLRDREALLALYVPVYARHLTEPEVRALTAFYREPLGARALAAQERIRETSRESAARLAIEVFGELAGAAPPDDAPGTGGVPSAATAPEGAAPSHVAAVRELIEISRVLPIAQETMRRLLESARANPLSRDTPAEAWARAERRLTDPDTLLAIWIPAYVEHMPEADVRAIVAFYRSPFGQRVATALPAIQSELVGVAQNYGAQAARRAIREVLGPLPTWRPPAERAPASPASPAEPPRP